MTVAAELRKQIPTGDGRETGRRRPSLAIAGRSEQLAWLGRLVIFGFKTFVIDPATSLVRHRNETVRLIADVTFGGGLMAVAASTVLVVFVIAAFVGITIGLEGYQGLQIIGLAPLAGYLSSYANTREIAPLITAFGLAAQMGCKFTTQLGAMRITEEIDALEVMSIRSLSVPRDHSPRRGAGGRHAALPHSALRCLPGHADHRDPRRAPGQRDLRPLLPRRS